MATQCFERQTLYGQDVQTSKIASGSLNLLHISTKVLLEIAQFYISDNKLAIRARQKVEKKSRGHLRDASFHATLFARLASLDALLELHLSENNIDEEEHRDVIEATLQVFEDVAGDADGQATRTYPGVRQLIQEYNLDKNDQRRPKPLGYRICLFCPSNDSQNSIVGQVLRCSDLLTARSGTLKQSTRVDVSSILTDIAALQEWRAPEGTTASAERLYRMLVRPLNCPCGGQHDHLKASLLASGNQYHGPHRYLLCTPANSSSPSTWNVSRIQVVDHLDSYQASTPKAAKVRFAEPETSPLVPRALVWQNYPNICDAFRSSGPNNELLINEHGVRSAPVSGPAREAVQIHLTSLQSSLTRNEGLRFTQASKKERIVLGVVLSYSYLYLSDTAWWPSGKVNPDFWFEHALESKGIQARRPFLAIEPNETKDGNSFSVEAFMNKERPSLPAFGKLLLEIWKGTSIEWQDLDAAIQECAEDYVGSYWLCAVHACLGDDSTLKEVGNVRDSPRLQSAFVHKVIKSLQWLLENLCRLTVYKVFEFGDDYQWTAKRPQDPKLPEPKEMSQTSATKSSSTCGPKRLINASTLDLEAFTGSEEWPEYAILSHRWTMAEVTFADWETETKEDRLGWPKIRGACRQASNVGIQYIWVDTCCIDKSSSSELNEAINSMFRWYRDAKVCYVYLPDVRRLCKLRDENTPYPRGSTGHRMINELKRSQWFQRGWTLQELLAPSAVEFYDANWDHIGQLGDIAMIISEITSISSELLLRKKAISDFSVAQRLSWASHRSTSKKEDEAYCLLGFFGVSLEARYGIGSLAFEELQKAILHSGNADDSLFAWSSGNAARQRKLFADSPANYIGCADVVCVQPRLLKTHLSCRSDGVGGRLALYQCQMHLDGWEGTVAVLNCMRPHQKQSLLALCLSAMTNSRDPDEVPDFVVTTCSSKKLGIFKAASASRRVISIDRSRLVSVNLREATIAPE